MIRHGFFSYWPVKSFALRLVLVILVAAALVAISLYHGVVVVNSIPTSLEMITDFGAMTGEDRDRSVKGQEEGKRPFSTKLDRIYYINMDKNVKRREMMEQQLRNQEEPVRIPFSRVPAFVGDLTKDTCVSMSGELYDLASELNRMRCQGLAGIAKTNLHIIDNLDTTGLTLVMEDDILMQGPIRIQETINQALAIVPPDWDIIRWHLLRDSPVELFHPVNEHGVYKTAAHGNKIVWCGGTQAMLWRESSVPLLKKIWQGPPYKAIDCCLTTDSLNSYILIGTKFWEHASPKGERTDIPKNERQLERVKKRARREEVSRPFRL